MSDKPPSDAPGCGGASAGGLYKLILYVSQFFFFYNKFFYERKMAFFSKKTVLQGISMKKRRVSLLSWYNLIPRKLFFESPNSVLSVLVFRDHGKHTGLRRFFFEPSYLEVRLFSKKKLNSWNSPAAKKNELELTVPQSTLLADGMRVVSASGRTRTRRSRSTVSTACSDITTYSHAPTGVRGECLFHQHGSVSQNASGLGPHTQ